MEHVIIRQNNCFESEFLSVNLQQPESGEFKSVERINQLTPHGLLLAGLGGYPITKHSRKIRKR